MNVSILGCGRWGTFLAWYFSYIGANVLLWGRETSTRISVLKQTRKNEYVTLDDKIVISTSLPDAINHCEIIVIAIEGHKISEFICVVDKAELSTKRIILAMKGFDCSSHQRLSSVVSEYLTNSENVAVLLGPGHPKEIVGGIATKMVIDSTNNRLKNELVNNLSSKLISLIVGDDIIGNEIGAAAKNVLGIAAGMLDAKGYSSLKGCLMVEGLKEISTLIEVLGGCPTTAYGTACLGDFQATLFSEQSNSLNYGKALVSGKPFEKFAPGKYTALSVDAICKQHHVYLPIFEVVYDVIYNHCSVDSIWNILINDNYDRRKKR